MIKPSEIAQIFLERNIKDVTFDSRHVPQGAAFIALKGRISNGNDFALKALEQGASIVITDDPTQIHDERFLLVKDSKVALADAAEYLYPLRIPHIVAVTGTNGKTSTTHFYRQILTTLGHKVANLGTTGLYYFDGDQTHHDPLSGHNMTTLDVVAFHKIAHKLAKIGITHLAIEASSHGLDQGRLKGITVQAAGFTSFSHDHLDYHGTMEDYLAAKMQLFSENLAPSGVALLSSTIPNCQQLKTDIKKLGRKCKIIGYEENADIIIDEYSEDITGSRGLVTLDARRKSDIQTQLIGSFQLSNLILAHQMAEVTLSSHIATDILDLATNVPGRMERVSNVNEKIHVFVDYSHTPDALEQSLNSLKKICDGQLIVVFGCGGNRDKSKRPLMGQVASQIANIVIVTDDNPRDEDPAAIREQILSKAPGAIEIADRANAIARAIEMMQQGDITLIAGKGHENYQIIGEKVINFDDALIAKAILLERSEKS